MVFLDIATPTLYFLSAVFALYALVFYGAYLRKRLKRGTFNMLFLALVVHVVTYVYKMTLLFTVRVTTTLGNDTALIEAMRTWGWFLAMCGTTFSFGLFAFLTYKHRYDIWVGIESVINKAEELRKENENVSHNGTDGREIPPGPQQPS